MKAAKAALAVALAFALASFPPCYAAAKVSAGSAPKASPASKPGAKPAAAPKPKRAGRTAAMNSVGGYAAACRLASSAPRVAAPSDGGRSGMFAMPYSPCPYPWWLAFGGEEGEEDEEGGKPEWMECNERFGDV